MAIDAGTSSIRAGLFDETGRCLRQASRLVAAPPTPVCSRFCSEVDPNELWSTACLAIRDLEVAPGTVAGVGVTAALGMVLAASDGSAQSPILTWQDRRAYHEALRIEQDVGAERVYAIAGRRIDPELTAARLMWFASNGPAVLMAADHCLSVKDWLVYKLCGEAVTDPATASYSLLYDVTEGAWSAEMLAHLSIRADLLPPVRNGDAVAGWVTAEAAGLTGLAQGTPVVVGGPDGTLGGIGGGVVHPGVAVDVLGTTDVVFACSGVARLDEARCLVLNRFPVDGRWSVGGPMAATGGVMGWLRDVLHGDIDTLTSEAAVLSRGAAGLTFFPSFAGSRTPRWNGDERGVIHGLGFEHGRGHLFRAALEGTAFEVGEVFAALDRSGVTVDEIRVVGGGTDNRLWLEIRAAVLGRPLVLPEVTEASALGAAMLAAVGVGLHADLGSAGKAMVRVREHIEPSSEAVAAYALLARRYAELRDCLSISRPPTP